jgi:hypothetical protein
MEAMITNRRNQSGIFTASFASTSILYRRKEKSRYIHKKNEHASVTHL